MTNTGLYRWRLSAGISLSAKKRIKKSRQGGARQRTQQKSQWIERESGGGGGEKRESEIIEKNAMKTQCGSKDKKKHSAKKDIRRRQMGEEKAVTPKRETAWKEARGGGVGGGLILSIQSVRRLLPMATVL